MSAEQPTVLPWHREAAKDVLDAQTFGRCLQTAAAIIARHDPHAEREAFLVKIANEQGEAMERGNNAIADLKAQHAATLRLLKSALFHLDYSDLEDADPVKKQIRAHLAAHSKPDETQKSAKQEGSQ